MEALMQLQIITPDRLMCDESVKMVEMRTAEGEIGVLPGHIPVTVMMAPGVSYNGYTFASTLKSLGRGIFSG